MAETTFIEAIRGGLQAVMREHPEVLLFGQDVGHFGGAFKATRGLQEEFGKDRVFDTPISESAMLGAAIGMATQGARPIVELQFADFATVAMHQLLNNACTVHYRTGVAVPMVVRAPCGGGFSGGPFHSEELESMFCHMPGLKVVYPAFPNDARMLLAAAIMDNSPVVFLENKYLYRHVKESIPDTIDPIRLGTARVCRSGRDVAILTYGAMVNESLAAAERIADEDGIHTTVVDMRTLKPYDTDTIMAAVTATSRVLIVHEGWHTCGFGAELAAFVAEHAFHLLDAPVRRLTAPDVPVPFAPELEKHYRPNADSIYEALIDLVEY
ncbi:MAG: alpha-ketoacid dehydrogenase subunit beta [Verrucomicrobia bacterium]|nr:alpha-ketoacid dehydrogenase subunit beta [Verrucomicrobiota bacterium]